MRNDALFLQDMWIKNRLKNLPNSLPASRSRKIALLVLVILVFLLYFGPTLFGRSHSKQSTECLQNQLHRWESDFNVFDVSIKHDLNEKAETAALPFVGNGNLGVVVGSTVSSDVLHIRYQHSVLSLAVPYVPIAQPHVQGLSAKEARVVHFREGLVYRIITESKESDCIVVTQKVLAHRSRPTLLLQQIAVENKGSFSAKLSVTVPGAYQWKDVVNKQYRSETNPAIPEFTVTVGSVKAPSRKRAEEFIMVSIATYPASKVIDVAPKSTYVEWVATVVHYSDPVPYNEMFVELHKKLEKETVQEMEELLAAHGNDFSVVAAEHLEHWQQLWSSGAGQEVFIEGADHQLPPNVLNSTLYYILSSVESNPSSDTTSVEKEQQLKEAGSCYSGMATWNNPSMWIQVRTEQELADLVRVWLHTLFHNGCANQLISGAHGVMQAFLLSLLAIQHNTNYLAVNADPRQFTHDLHIYHIIYNKYDLDISILAMIKSVQVHVTPRDVEGEDKYRRHLHVFACDAGCEKDPVMIKQHSHTFTLKYTEPQLTPFLYISEQSDSLVDLKKYMHYKSIKYVSLPHPPEHSTVRLPPVFWVTVVILIVAFHLFLFRLIYNEFCSGQDKQKFRAV
ncbi:uncharacterized protein KIAA2013 homolog isoform X2 [Ptychodera flava]|uniref:uncharacterized protein KIAA2013 homolog isoform X2 n=1 Tax=Ptychodera flava TaxID=63121 RepID=UPI00396A8207